MNGAFYIGATGLGAEQRALDVIANNIANVNTAAYKRSSVRFSELAAPPAQQQTSGPQDVDQVGALSGVSIDASPRDFTQGPIQQTGKPLDVAINGAGFFELLGPSGQITLWRGGSLEINGDGYLAASNGMPLSAMIAAPTDATSVTIGPDGTVQAVMGSSATATTIGQIDLVQVKDPTTLTTQGDGLYEPANASDVITAAPGQDGAGVLVSGSIETSNVQLSDEMVTMLLLQRAYAANAQVVQAGDQLMAIANSLKR